MRTKTDVVYTPEWCAKDMIEWFKPLGRILESAKGAGVFLDLLPQGTQWCEISEGVDFFDWKEHVDWIISNPPYSKTRSFLRHSYNVADNIVYLLPFRNVTSGFGLLKEMREYGWMKHVRIYGTGGKLNFPMGNAVAAFHIKRGYRGDTEFSFYGE